MKIFGLEISLSKNKEIEDAVPISTVKPGGHVPISRIPSVRVAPLVYAQQFARVNRGVFFLAPEYDLAEIGKIEDTESLVRQAFKKKEGLMFKEGVAYRGKDKTTIQYIKTRMAQVAQASGIPTISLMKRVARSLIRCSNAYLVKVRSTKASGGQVRKTADGKNLQPVAAYFPAAPEMFKMDLDPETGKIRHWRQQLPNGWYKLFKPEDVVHFTLDKREGFSYGVPSLVPVVDDIRALRQIEENIELLIYQHLFPLFHYKVGTENKPALYTEDGKREVDLVRDEIRMMPAEGMLVTDERAEIVAIGAEGRAMNAEGYMNYFKKRVYMGLGMSSVDFGEADTSNRATANVVSRALVDAVKSIQDEFEAMWDQHVIRELLLESTFGEDVLEEEFMVHLRFSEIDIQNKIEHEKHAAEMFKMEGLTWDEFRNELGQEPIIVPEDPQDQDPANYPEWHNTHWKLFLEPEKLISAVDEPYCYTQDSEILTLDGWKYFNELEDSDQVAVLKDGEELNYEVPRDRVSFNYEGEIYHLSTRFVDIAVTPNHKLYVADTEHDRRPDSHPFELRRADELFGQYKKFKRTALWEGKSPEYFHLPELNREDKYHPDKRHFPPRDIPIKEWLQFLGWHLSEGWHGDCGQMGIAQSDSVHPENYEEIRYLLECLEIDPHKDDKGWNFSDFQIKNWLLTQCGHYAHEKHIPTVVKELSPNLLWILLDTMMKGDGETNYHYLYSTTSKRLADDIQEIALKIGCAANIRIEKRTNENCHDMYRVAINMGKYADVSDRCTYRDLADSSVEEWIPYSGKVYCVTTSTGVIYVRRNGKARWCGNSNAAQAAVQARSSAFTKEGQAAAQQGALQMQKAAHPAPTSRPSKAPRAKDSYLGEAFEDLEKDTSGRLLSSVRNRGRVDKEYLTTMARNWSKSVADKMASQAAAKLIQGFSDQTGGYSMGSDELLSGGRKKVADRIQKTLDRLARDVVNLISHRIEKKLGDKSPAEEIDNVIDELHIAFDAVRYRTDFMSDVEIRKAYNYGRLLGLQRIGAYGFQLVAHAECCDRCHAVDGRIFLAEDADIDDVPPYHANSRMEIKVLFHGPAQLGHDEVWDSVKSLPIEPGKAVSQESEAAEKQSAVCPKCGFTAMLQPRSGNYYCIKCRLAFRKVEDDMNVGGSGTVPTRQPSKPQIEKTHRDLAPVKRPCPRCGLSVETKNGKYKCTRCNYTFKEGENPRKVASGKPISPMPPKKRKEEAELPASTGGPGSGGDATHQNDDILEDGAKLESCVLQVKAQYRKDHPGMSEDEIKSHAFAICNAQLKKGK